MRFHGTWKALRRVAGKSVMGEILQEASADIARSAAQRFSLDNKPGYPDSEKSWGLQDL